MKTLEFLRKHAVVLSPNEMKAIGGGACGYSVTIGGESFIDCNVTGSIAQSMVATHGGNWCCASCGISSYCGGNQQ